MTSSLASISFEPHKTGPLSGIRVLDLSRLVCGNILSFMLADFGAEVIKIERPGTGDTLREWRTEGVSVYWKIFGRSKKSVAIDISNEASREVLLRLVENAHCLVESFLVGTLEKYGLGEEELLRRNPALVIVRVSGWGQTGPYREKPGFGTLIESFSGLAEKTGFPDSPPLLPSFPIADQLAGLTGAFAALVAIRNAERTGKGQVVDLSVLEPLHGMISADAAIFEISKQRPQRTGSRSLAVAPRNLYPTADGRYVAIAASTQATARRLLVAIGRPELNDDPRFRQPEARLAHVEELDAIIGEWIAKRSLEEALRIFEDAGVTAGPVNTVDMLMTDEHIAERQILVRAPDDEIGTILMPGVFPRLSETPGAVRAQAPAIGAHTTEILCELGLQDDEIAELRKVGAVQ
jgi:crotonobetainyl-CoA:carnitine CoA-transferase CaiB-like acyl-CoA transferase